MADRDIFVEVPATNHDLLTLDEAKMLLGLSLADTSKDAQLSLQISIASQTIARMANRIFAEQTVIETWREVGNGRLFLSQWPIDEATGIIDVTAGGNGLSIPDYDLEGQSGKLSVYGGSVSIGVPYAIGRYPAGYIEAVGSSSRRMLRTARAPIEAYYPSNTGHWSEPAVVHYTGGYKLPDEAPMPLKQAAAVLIRQERMFNQQAQVAGMRQIRHKEAQVSFYDPNALLMRAMGASTSPGMQQAQALIDKYMRIEV